MNPQRDFESKHARVIARQQPQWSRSIASGAVKQWARGPGLITNARAEADRVTAEEWTRRQTFRSLPTQNDFKAIVCLCLHIGPRLYKLIISQAYYLWPSQEIHPSEILGNSLKNLDPIRETCGIYIDWDASMQSLRLRSSDGRMVYEALEGLKAALRDAKAQAAGIEHLYIVQPPSMMAMTSAVTPVLSQVPSLVRQPVIESVALTGHKLSTQDRMKWDKQRSLLVAKQWQTCYTRMMDAFERLRSLQTPLRLRVNFGAMHISTYKKDFQGISYNFDKFANMMGESRTKAALNKQIPYLPDGIRLLDEIRSARDVFCPADSTTLSMDDIKPRHGLVILACTSVYEQLRLEADIDAVQNGGDDLFQIGTTHYNLHDTRQSRFNVGVMDLERYVPSTIICQLHLKWTRKFDWSVELVTDAQILKPTRDLQNLIGMCKPSTTGRVDSNGLLYPSVSLSTPPGIAIDEVLVKSVTRYRVLRTPFLVEITIYHRWNTPDTAGDPLTQCGVTLYNKDWDLLLSPRDRVPDLRGFSRGLDELFPSLSDNQSGFAGFVDSITRVQGILSKVQETVSETNRPS
ncbi:MAG: hypothetical protein M1818_007546 [Claussenomyces sp. TS43310]|nr:MAG: hypothetical protein M1818_007546 [Claussenomyces sp. TS43310]